MIARHETHMDKVDIWSALAAPLPSGVISWRQDGRPVSRDGKHLARFVAYITANTVRKRLDAIVPGEFDSTIELLPPLSSTGGDGETNEEPVAFKCRLQILGVIREDVGSGKDYKSAATDAFKRAATRFGIGHELYEMEPLWVQMDGDGKYAKPIEDPAVAYARRYGSPRPTTANSSPAASALPQPSNGAAESDEPRDVPAAGPLASDEESCPKCGGRMWNNKLTKRNPKAPDFKCRDRACDGVIWPPREAKGSAAAASEEVEEIPF